MAALPASLSAQSFPFIPARFSFCSKLIESVRMMACMVCLSPEALQCNGHVWLLPPPLSNWRPCWLHCLQEWWSPFAEKPTQIGSADWWSVYTMKSYHICRFLQKTSLTSESACVPFPLLGLLELSASMLAVFTPLLAPSQSVSLFCLLWLHGVGLCGFSTPQKQLCSVWKPARLHSS